MNQQGSRTQPLLTHKLLAPVQQLFELWPSSLPPEEKVVARDGSDLQRQNLERKAHNLGWGI